MRQTYVTDLVTAHSNAVALGLRPYHARGNVIRYMEAKGWIFEGDTIKVTAGVGVDSPLIKADRIWHRNSGRDKAI